MEQRRNTLRLEGRSLTRGALGGGSEALRGLSEALGLRQVWGFNAMVRKKKDVGCPAVSSLRKA